VTPAEYKRYDATALADLVRRKEVSAFEILDASIQAIEGDNPRLGAVVQKFYDRGRQEIQRGLPDGPFTGVPFLLKDTVTALAGTTLSAGRYLQGVLSTRDSSLVRRYKAAGLVVIGKTNIPELSLSFTTEPAAGPITRNPWDETRSAGGSCGGSAVAVTAGFVPIAHGTDGAGSLRVPAAHCGAFGSSPAAFVRPLGPDVAEGLAGMSCAHCISRSVRDSAILLDTTTGEDIGDPYAVPGPQRSFARELDSPPPRLRIALSTRSPTDSHVDSRVQMAVTKVAALCEGLGHAVTETDPDYDGEALKAAWRIVGGVAAAAAVRSSALPDSRGRLEAVNAAWIEQAERHSACDYVQAVSELHRVGRSLGRFFADFDVLLTPTTAEPPPPLGRLAGRSADVSAFYDDFWAHAPFTAAFNASGGPAMSMPLGWTSEGLPIGAHFGSRLGSDGLLYALAGQLERAAPWIHRYSFSDAAVHAAARIQSGGE